MYILYSIDVFRDKKGICFLSFPEYIYDNLNVHVYAIYIYHYNVASRSEIMPCVKNHKTLESGLQIW